MRKYEFMVVFNTNEDKYNAGLESVKKILSDAGVVVEEEKPYGDRDLCYEIKKEKKGRYILFNIQAATEKIIEIERLVKLNTNVLTFMFVRVEK